jgi:hypothetical protein
MHNGCDNFWNKQFLYCTDLLLASASQTLSV